MFLVVVLSLPVGGQAAHEPSPDLEASNQEALGDAAVTLSISVEGPTHCLLTFEMAGTEPADGIISELYVLQVDDQEPGWYLFEQTDLYRLSQVHALDQVDTRHLVEDDSRWFVYHELDLEIERTAELTIAARNLEPWDEAIAGPGVTAGLNSTAMTADCAGPATASLEASRAVELFTPMNMGGGVGVSNLFLGGVQVADHAGGEFTASKVRLMSAAAEAQAGVVTYDHPDGSSSWALSPATTAFVDLAGGPGEHRVTVTRASGGVLDTWWGLLAGYHEVEDLDSLSELPTL